MSFYDFFISMEDAFIYIFHSPIISTILSILLLVKLFPILIGIIKIVVKVDD